MEANIQQVPQGSVIITPTKMYEEMQDIGKKVDHLTTVMDPALNTLRETVVELKGELAVAVAERKADVIKLDTRIRVLENWRWFVLGIAAIVSPAATVLIDLLIRGK